MNELPVEWVIAGAGLLSFGMLTCAVLALCLLVTVRRLRRDCDTSRRRFQVLRKAVLELGHHQQTSGQQLQGLNRQIEVIRQQQQELETRDVSGAAYSHASRLVEMGAGSRDLVANCGLSEAEARLISLMHPSAAGREVA